MGGECPGTAEKNQQGTNREGLRLDAQPSKHRRDRRASSILLFPSPHSISVFLTSPLVLWSPPPTTTTSGGPLVFPSLHPICSALIGMMRGRPDRPLFLLGSGGDEKSRFPHCTRLHNPPDHPQVRGECIISFLGRKIDMMGARCRYSSTNLASQTSSNARFSLA